MKTLFTFSLLIISVFTVNAQRQSVDVDEFTKVSFGVSGTLYLTQGNEYSVEIDASDDVMDDIEIVQAGSQLKIKNRKSWSRIGWNSPKVKVYVTMKSINSLSVSGSGDMIGESEIETEDIKLSVSGSGSMELDLSADEVDIDISGSGKIYLDGNADEVETSISGSGKVKAKNFDVNVFEANISGSGSCYITANKEVDARISGSGSVYYKGNPDRVSSRSSGSGKVRKM